MIKVGKRQKLVINNFSSVGAYLFAGTDDDKDNILLPNNELEGKDLKTLTANKHLKGLKRVSWG